MPNSVTIETKAYDTERAGWFVRAVSVINGDSRAGQEFVALPENATDEQLKTAVIALYS